MRSEKKTATSGITHHSSMGWICYPISTLQSHEHITPVLYSQLDSFVPFIVTPNQSYISTSD